MNNKIKLSTGKEIYANKRLISIRFTDEWEMYEGYDGNIYFTSGENSFPLFTQEELLELAQMMINQWKLFSIDIINGKIPTYRVDWGKGENFSIGEK